VSNVEGEPPDFFSRRGKVCTTAGVGKRQGEYLSKGGEEVAHPLNRLTRGDLAPGCKGEQ